MESICLFFSDEISFEIKRQSRAKLLAKYCDTSGFDASPRALFMTFDGFYGVVLRAPLGLADCARIMNALKTYWAIFESLKLIKFQKLQSISKVTRLKSFFKSLQK